MKPIPVATGSKAWVYAPSLPGIAPSNLAGAAYLCLINVVCCQLEVSVTGRRLFQRSPTECGVLV